MKTKEYQSYDDLHSQSTSSEPEASSNEDSDDDSKYQQNSLFDKPWFQFEKWKSEIIEKVGFEGKYSWGTLGSEDRVTALSFLYPFLKGMLNRHAEESKNFKDKIIHESLNFVLGKVLPIPQKLYEEIIDAISETAVGLQNVSELSNKDKLDTVVKVLDTKYKSSVLARNHLDRE